MVKGGFSLAGVAGFSGVSAELSLLQHNMVNSRDHGEIIQDIQFKRSNRYQSK
jgi:hypothetical protein